MVVIKVGLFEIHLQAGMDREDYMSGGKEKEGPKEDCLVSELRN